MAKKKESKKVPRRRKSRVESKPDGFFGKLMAARSFKPSKVRTRKLAAGDSIRWGEAGQTVTGIYLGAEKKINLNGEGVLYHYSDEKGQTFQIWEASALKTLGLIPKGTIVTIKYLGKKKSSTSKRSYNTFEISVPEDCKVELPDSPF